MLHNTLCKFIVMTVSWFLQSSCKVFDKRSNDERYEAIVVKNDAFGAPTWGALC